MTDTPTPAAAPPAEPPMKPVGFPLTPIPGGCDRLGQTWRRTDLLACRRDHP